MNKKFNFSSKNKSYYSYLILILTILFEKYICKIETDEKFPYPIRMVYDEKRRINIDLLYPDYSTYRLKPDDDCPHLEYVKIKVL